MFRMRRERWNDMTTRGEQARIANVLHFTIGEYYCTTILRRKCKRTLFKFLDEIVNNLIILYFYLHIL